MRWSAAGPDRRRARVGPAWSARRYDPMLGKVIVHGADPRGRPPRPGRRPRRHRDPRPDHQPRLPARRWPPPTSSATPPSTPAGSTATPTRRPPDGRAGRGARRLGARPRCAGATRRHPFGVGDGWRLGRPARTVPVELDGRRRAAARSRSTAAAVGRGRPTWRVHQVAGRAGTASGSRSTASCTRRPCCVGAHEVEVALPRPHASSSPGPTRSAPARPPASATGPSPRRCPGTVLAVDVAEVGSRVEEGDGSA